MHPKNRREIFRFEHDALLYRMYFFENAEIAFTVTGPSLRLGLLSPEDFRWNWFWDLPEVQETSRQVHVHAAPVKVMRTLALRLAQYLDKHRPVFFFYTLHDHPRRQRLYQKLIQRHAQVAALYDMQLDDSGCYVLFTSR